jgi:integrase
MALMQTVFERAVRYDRIGRNPVKPIKKPSAKRTSRPRPISPAAVEKIRAQLDGQDALMVAVLAYTGIRPGEARGLRWGDIGDRRISVERAVSGATEKPTKTDAMRTVPLVPSLAADLKAARGDAPDDTYVFVLTDGTPWTDAAWHNWRRRRFMPAAAAAGVAISRPYDLRHSAASLWLHEGYRSRQVAHWLGHRPSMTEDTYGHVLDDLDPAARFVAVEAIEQARQDIARTYAGVVPGQSEGPAGRSEHGDLRAESTT